jgi:hypothetical protein
MLRAMIMSFAQYIDASSIYWNECVDRHVWHKVILLFPQRYEIRLWILCYCSDDANNLLALRGTMYDFPASGSPHQN